jgi:hypothetical protein
MKPLKESILSRPPLAKTVSCKNHLRLSKEEKRKKKKKKKPTRFSILFLKRPKEVWIRDLESVFLQIFQVFVKLSQLCWGHGSSE